MFDYGNHHPAGQRSLVGEKNVRLNIVMADEDKTLGRYTTMNFPTYPSSSVSRGRSRLHTNTSIWILSIDRRNVFRIEDCNSLSAIQSTFTTVGSKLLYSI